MFCAFSTNEAPPGAPEKLFVFFPGEPVPEGIEEMKAWVKSLKVLPAGVRYTVTGPFDGLVKDPNFFKLFSIFLPLSCLQSSSPVAVAPMVMRALAQVPRIDSPVGQRGASQGEEAMRDRFGFQDVPVDLINTDPGGGPWSGGGAPDQGTWTDIVQQGGGFVEVARSKEGG